MSPRVIPRQMGSVNHVVNTMVAMTPALMRGSLGRALRSVIQKLEAAIAAAPGMTAHQGCPDSASNPENIPMTMAMAAKRRSRHFNCRLGGAGIEASSFTACARVTSPELAAWSCFSSIGQALHLVTLSAARCTLCPRNIVKHGNCCRQGTSGRLCHGRIVN